MKLILILFTALTVGLVVSVVAVLAVNQIVRIVMETEINYSLLRKVCSRCKENKYIHLDYQPKDKNICSACNLALKYERQKTPKTGKRWGYWSWVENCMRKDPRDKVLEV